MARRHLNLADMVYRLQFGHYQQSNNINHNTGKPIKNEFKMEFERWAAKGTFTQTELLSLAGANIKDAVKFLIRHDENITSDYILRLNDKLYSIDMISYGQYRMSDNYDTITCHRVVTKHG